MSSSAKSPAGSGLRVIVVLAAAERLGGAERSAVEQAVAARRQGDEFRIFSLERPNGVVAALCARQGVEFVRFENTKDLVSQVRRDRPDAVYAFGLRWSTIFRAARASGLLGVGRSRSLLISAQRGMDVWRNERHNRVDRFTQFLVDRYVSNSFAAATMLQETVGISRNRISVVAGGVGREWTEPTGPDSATDDEVVDILLAGNNRPEKAYPDALEVLAGVVDLRWRATVYTDDETDVRRLVEQHDLCERVTTVSGARLEPADFDQFDLLLHAAASESYPRVVVEACSRGLAVVATDVGDVRRIVDNDTELFQSGDLQHGRELLRRAIERCPSRDSSPGDIRTMDDVAADFSELVLGMLHSKGAGRRSSARRSN